MGSGPPFSPLGFRILSILWSSAPASNHLFTDTTDTGYTTQRLHDKSNKPSSCYPSIQHKRKTRLIEVTITEYEQKRITS
jgi:hypothetical protein